MKLKTLIQINEWISHGPVVNRSPDSNLRPVPGGMNDNSPNWKGPKGWNDDVEDWDAIVEGENWFVYKESNDWHNKKSGASVYINEDEKPHKMWIKIKTHGLRKPTDTNESYKQKIRKHTDKVAGAWVGAAKKIHDNLELNEVGNPITVTWKHAFKEALNDPKVKSYLSEKGENDISPISDPVNFTPRV